MEQIKLIKKYCEEILKADLTKLEEVDLIVLEHIFYYRIMLPYIIKKER